jgi:hypothetical protein
LEFLLEAASPETSGYTLVLGRGGLFPRILDLQESSELRAQVDLTPDKEPPVHNE